MEEEKSPPKGEVKMEECGAGDSVPMREDVVGGEMLHRLSLENMEDQRMKWQSTPMPEKMKGASSVPAQTLEVNTNLYKMDLTGLKTVYKYRIDLVKTTSDGKEKDVTKGPKADYVVQLRRRVLQSIWADVLDVSKKRGTEIADKYHVVYDSGNLVFAAHRLELPPGAFSVELKFDELSSSNTKSFLGKKTVKVVATLQFVEEISGTLRGGLEEVRVTQQFLEVLTSALVVKNQDHLMYKNKTYPKSSKSDAQIGEAKVVKSGNEKNCRVVQDVNGKAAAMLQIDAKKSPFHVNGPLVDYALRLLQKRDVHDIDSRDLKRLNTQLKEEWVKTTHQAKPRLFAVHSLSSQTANSATFERDGKTISVAEYFEVHLKMRLKYPDLPLVVERKAQNVSYHPLEVLELERGQRVHMKKATPSMGEKMIKECQLKPFNLLSHIEVQLKDMMLDEHNKYLVAFGVSISKKVERAEARVLHPAAIRYAGSQMVEPQRDGSIMWRVQGREKFLKPAQLKGKSLFVIFDRCIRTDDAHRFMQSVERVAREHSVSMNIREMKVIEMRSELDDEIQNMFADAAKQGVQMIFAVTKMKLDPVHDTLKHFEAKFNIVTQHISFQTLMKAIGNQGAFMVLNNLCLKMNPKLGGVNHGLNISKAFLTLNVNDRTAQERIIPTTRMFVGIDVSHAGPQSFADRQLGVEQSEPTVVGMSYSLEEATDMRGFYWMQRPRLATVSNLTKYTMKALESRYKETKRLPDDIFVFRGGVSEGEFGKVVEEMGEMSKAFSHFNDKTRSGRYQPSLSCLVIQNNSNYRIVPTRINEQDRPMDQNVRPGTVVDSEVVHPNYNEFILIPQKALQGTARPIRCTLVYCEKGSTGTLLSLDDMQILTNVLCYGHQAFAGSTGVPCHMYAATNLTKRGRNNWKTANFADSDLRSEISGGSGGGKFKNDGRADFFERVSEEVKSRVPSQYWA